MSNCHCRESAVDWESVSCCSGVVLAWAVSYWYEHCIVEVVECGNWIVVMEAGNIDCGGKWLEMGGIREGVGWLDDDLQSRGR